MLDLLFLIIFGFFIYLMIAVFVIAIGILILMRLKDIQRKTEKGGRSDT